MKKINAIAIPLIAIFLLFGAVGCTSTNQADEGHSLWFKTSGTSVVKNIDKSDVNNASLNIAKAELAQYGKSEDEVELSLLNPQNSALGNQGYTIDASNPSKVKISSNTQIGLLYGTYAYMREDKTAQLSNQVQTEIPSYNDRILDH